jgi:apolipoprotein N-acyltransferase
MLSFPALSLPLALVFIYSALTLHALKNKRTFYAGIVLTIFLSLFTFTINDFFINNPLLFTLTLFYFTAFITLDLYALSLFSTLKKFTVTAGFVYIIFSRILLSRLSFLFPLYYTLQAHYLPFTGVLSKYVLPVLFEALIITAAVTVFQTLKYKKYLPIVEFFIISAVCIFSTMIYRHAVKIKIPEDTLSISFVQLSFSRDDYFLSDKYPGFGEKIAQKYLEYAKNTPEARLLILPESSFPYIDFENDMTLKELKLLAKQKNQYIIFAYYSKNEDKTYNSVILLGPDGGLADIYSKNSVVPIFESKWAAASNKKVIFNIDAYKIQPLVCYETVFWSAYQYKISNLIIALSNAVFSEGIAYSRLHNAYGIFHSRTFNIPYLQITQDGPSFYVDKNYKLYFLSGPGEIFCDKIITIP